MLNFTLQPLSPHDRPTFIRQLQHAFQAAFEHQPNAPQEFVISECEITESLDAEHAQAFGVWVAGKLSGGVVLSIRPNHFNALDLFYIDRAAHGQQLGFRVWQAVEQMFPETIVWETHTPYMEKRNIHFYVNKCGFQIVEFFHAKHPDPHQTDTAFDGSDEFFRFEKWMKPQHQFIFQATANA